MKKLNQTEVALRQEIIARKLATEAQLDGKLSIPFMNGCHSKVNQYLSLVRPGDVDDAYNKPLRAVAGKLESERIKAKQLWSGVNPYDESSILEIHKFRALYKQFDSTNVADREAMLNYLKVNNLLVTLPNLIAAFEHLVLAGTLTLLPEAIGLTESEVTGYKLQHHQHLSTLLSQHPIVSEATSEQQRISKLSADEYKREFLKDEISEREVKHNQREAFEFTQRHPEVDIDVDGVWQAILDALSEESLGINHDALEYIIRTPQLLKKLKEMDAIWTTTPSTEYRAGASSLVDRRVQKPSLPAKEISIEEGRKKTWTHRQILGMTADEYQMNREKYGAEFERAVNEAF